jgi:hypothetical protein
MEGQRAIALFELGTRSGGGDTFTGVQIMKFASAFKIISRNVTLS